jgi:hypothetical protein
MALLKELSFKIAGSATSNLPFLGGVLGIFYGYKKYFIKKNSLKREFLYYLKL